MKGPKPNLLERVLGRTVEVEIPGKPGRRRVSRKWFDAMVAEGKFTMVPAADESYLASRAVNLVRVARLGPIGFFVRLLDRFPNLSKATPEDWHFLLGVAAVCAGLVQHEILDSSPERNRVVRRVAAEELLKWRPDALEALEDCEEFVVRTMGVLLDGGKMDWQAALAQSVGVWVMWNLLRRKSEEEADLELAAVVGGLVLRIIDGCWGRNEEGA